MLKFYELLIIFISLFLIFRSIRKTIKSNKTIYLIHLLFCFIYVLPLLLDYIIGYPSYSTTYYGFLISYKDTATRIIYATYILASQFIMLIVGNIKFASKYKYINNVRKENKDLELLKSNNFNHNEKYSIYVDYLLLFASLFTVALVIVFPISKNILWMFGWRNMGVYIEGQKFYSTIERISYISIVSGLIYIFRKKRNLLVKLFIIPFILMTICVQGKRSILFFTAVIIISYLLFNVSISKRKWIYILAFMTAIGLLYYSIYVKVTYRGYSGFASLYTTLRIDFFRDDTVKLVIYSLLNPNKIKILEYPGQSIITQFGALFPLQYLGVPVIGYNTYLTSALIGSSFNIQNNWMTTSIFDEALANFGFIGFWISPTILGIFSKVADKQNLKLVPITISAVMLIMMYSPNYILWFIQFWFVITLFEKLSPTKFKKYINN